MRGTIGRGEAPIRQPSHTSTRPTARPSSPSFISAASAACSQVDGYSGYRALADRHDVKLAFCWAHVREFVDFAAKGDVADRCRGSEPHRGLYRIEGEIAGQSAETRRLAREERSRPLLVALEHYLREKLALISQKSTLADAIRYATSRWTGLLLFIEDGRVEMDSNTVERSIRPLALNRKMRSSLAPTAAASTGPSLRRSSKPAS